MFSIIISEKGGAERRESYDKTEINVGRVQGNDLMLPKGNVSKRHARLLFRDGRFIVTDLKSTNGTYVNGRKITQATIVREGDKIYIGDFVIRIEVAGAEGASHATPPGGEELSDPSTGGAPTGAPRAAAPEAPAPAVPMPPRVPAGMGQPATASPLPGGLPPPAPVHSTTLGTGAAAPALGAPTEAPPAIMSGMAPSVPPPPPAPVPIAPPPPAPIPVAPPPPAPVAPPPPPPAPVAPAPVPPAPVAPPPPVHVAPPPAAPIPVAPMPPAPVAPPPTPPAQVTPAAPAPIPPAQITPIPHAPPPPAPAQPGPVAPPAAVISDAEAPAPSGSVRPPPPASLPSSAATPSSLSSGAVSSGAGSAGSGSPSVPRSSVRQAAASDGVVDHAQASAHRAALAKLMERATQALPLDALATGAPIDPGLVAAFDRALAEQAQALGASRELPEGIDAEVLVAEARRELLELGPLGPLLDDEHVEEIQIVRHDHVIAVHDKRQIATEIAFTSEAAVARVVRRLCVRAGKPLAERELFVDRRLPSGVRLFGVLPPASGDGHMLVLRRPQRAFASLDDLVRAGTISRAMATLFAHAVQGRANILVTGALQAGAASVLGALAGAGSVDDRLVVLQEDDELVFNQPHTISMLLGDTAAEGAQAVRAAIRVRPDRLVVGSFAGHVVGEVVDAIGDGLDGVLARAHAPSLRHLVTRLPADLTASRTGLMLDTAREWLASSFDLVVEVARLRDGRTRVMRVAEFALEPGAPLGLRDVFEFNVDRTAAGGTVEGSFHATGVVPRLAEDLVARGMQLDTSVFKRAAR